ncbi:MAG: PHP domain-containing protein [Clostridia bacterium]|nr:PHP domain-containing protein [Clostridia bacterium]
MEKLFYDFHIHSCLSPCGDEDMTPNNIVNMAMLNGLNCIAVTDHNCVLNCEAAINIGKKQGITVLPGMELETSEEVHILCLFPCLEKAKSFSDYVSSNMPKIPLDKEIFGEEIIMDDEDKIIGNLDTLLNVATFISCDDISKIIKDYGGVAIAAHVDKMANSIISNLGFITEEMGFSTIEFSKNCPEDFLSSKKYLDGYNYLYNSDAHYLWDINDNNRFIEVEENTPEAIIEFLSKRK